MSHCRRGKDYSRPVGFVSAGVQGGTRQEGDEEEGGSDSEDEVIITSYIRVHVHVYTCNCQPVHKLHAKTQTKSQGSVK